MRTFLIRGIWVALSLVPVWAFLAPVAPFGHDISLHFLRIVALADLWSETVQVPRWAPSLGAGLGYPLFLYYGWLPYALPALLFMGGVPVAVGYNAFILCCALLLARGAWKLGEELGGRPGGMVCWALVVYAPYQLVNLYVRASPGEYAAGALGVWALWSVVRVARKPHDRMALVSGVFALALLAFTHNIGAAVFFVIVTLTGAGFALAAGGAQARRGAVGRVALVVGGGLAGGAHFAVPLLAARNWVVLDRVFAHGFSYEQHFATAGQLLLPSWGYGLSVPGPGDTMSFQLGLVHLAVVAAGVVAAVVPGLRIRRRVRGSVAALAGGALVLAFLTTGWSEPLWKLVPPLRVLQFPWRLLLPASVLAGMAGALVVPFCLPLTAKLLRRAGRRRVAAGVAVLAVVASLPYARPKSWSQGSAANLREMLTRAYTTTCINDEYRPCWASLPQGEVDASRFGHALVGGQFRIPLPPPEKRMRISFPVASRTEASVVVPLFYFPNWRARAGELPLATRPSPKNGYLSFTVPPGAHQVSIEWKPSPLMRISESVSLATLLGFLFWLLVSRRKNPSPSSTGGSVSGGGNAFHPRRRSRGGREKRA